MERDYALVVVDEYLLHWADEVVCMTRGQAVRIKDDHGFDKHIICLDIEDSYNYRDPELMGLIPQRYEANHPENQKVPE